MRTTLGVLLTAILVLGLEMKSARLTHAQAAVQEPQHKQTEGVSRLRPGGDSSAGSSPHKLERPLPLYLLNCNFAEVLQSALHANDRTAPPDVTGLALRGVRLTVAGWEAVCRWDLSTGKRLSQWGKKGVWVHGLSPDGRMVAIREFKQNVHLVETASGKDLRPLNGTSDFFTGRVVFTFSLDSRIVAASHVVPAGYRLRLWELGTGVELPSLVVPWHPSCVALSPDGKLIALGHGWGNMDIELYDANTRLQLRRFGEPCRRSFVRP